VALRPAMRYQRPVNLARLAATAACAALVACAGPRAQATPPPGPAGLDLPAAREVLLRFAALLEAGDYERAYPLLASRWRARSSPARLARDHAGGPAGREVVARTLRTGGAAPGSLEGGRARLALGEGREAVLVAEGGVWRVDALEEREKGAAAR
jgi:hypothetical protein